MLSWIIFSDGSKVKGKVIEIKSIAIPMIGNSHSIRLYYRVKVLSEKRIYNTEIDEINVKLVKSLTSKKIVCLVKKTNKRNVFYSSSWNGELKG
jgi:hypothetical protein